MERRYVNVAETAKLVRQALKESFPGVKFSVRSDSYSGGASIRVRYEDGPAAKLVEAVAKQFEGGYFDGMIDYKGSVYHQMDGQPVKFGADFIFVNRDHSDAQIARAIEFVAAKYGERVVDGLAATVDDFKMGRLWSVPMFENFHAGIHNLQGHINQALAKFSSVAQPAKSATLARVKPAGDDGYGAGTVGQDGKGGENGYARPERTQQRAEVGGLVTQIVKLAEFAAMEPVGGVQ